VVTVVPDGPDTDEDADPVELVATLAVGDLVCSRLPEPEAGPVGQRVRFRRKR